MFDSNLKVWLIEANNNPGLSECKSPALNRVLSYMMEHMIQIAVDPLFPPPYTSKVNTNYLQVPENMFKENKFELIFDQDRDGIELEKIEELDEINELVKIDMEKISARYED